MVFPSLEDVMTEKHKEGLNVNFLKTNKKYKEHKTTENKFSVWLIENRRKTWVTNVSNFLIKLLNKLNPRD